MACGGHMQYRWISRTVSPKFVVQNLGHAQDRSMLQEFWRNELAEDAEDIDERRMLQLYEQRQTVDAAGKKGLSPLQKCTATIRQLTYGAPADHYDEYLRIAETTATHCLFNFCRCVIEVFGAQYLRRPNAADIQHLLEMHEQRHGFPDMLDSLDCMHWQWKICPVAWKGSRNDINVLNESPLFNDALQGNALEVNFTINNTQYTKGYYLTDGIYPE
ncbi:uncharacterized protein LOC122001970 [Zingiber officinale]|uniref:uncharacterized protein LOC122001970 n=1 Tax=Zingiber officinale TaxID=94328 RepID=UPI001C4A9584|nr:uncharacterized protein LOC122001970 [Zingiber officinale]